MMLLLIAAVVFGVVSQLVYADSCDYDGCIFRNLPSRFSGVETYLVYLRIDEIPNDLAQQCAILVDRVASCENQTANCPTELEEKWEKRMYDPVYVKFLMLVGNVYCKQPQSLFALRDCFTEPLQLAVKSCIHGNHDFDFVCIRERYNSLENCPDNTDAIFYDIVDKYLVHNPYNTRNG